MLVKKFHKNIGHNNIISQGGTLSILSFGGSFGACFPPYFPRYYSFRFKPLLFFAEDKYGVVFFDGDAYVQALQTTYRRFLKNEKNIKELRDFKTTWKKAEDLHQTYLAKKEHNEQELISFAKKAFGLEQAVLVETVFSEPIEETFVKKEYLAFGGKEETFRKFFEACSSPAEPSFALRNMQIMVDGAKNKKNIDHILSDYYICPDHTEATALIQKKLNEKGGIAKIQTDIKQIKNEINKNKKVSDKLRATLSPNLRKLFDFVQTGIYIRDIRKEPYNKVLYIISDTTRKILSEQKINSSLAPWVSFVDYHKGAILKKNFRNELKKRSLGCIVYYDQDGWRYEYGKLATAKKEIYGIIDKYKKASTKLHGACGAKGKASGQIRIVLGANDFQKFKKGDVLVTSMTRPEFVPLMKLASAIITDEGGITCHASIISRELKKPCVIGTKDATRVLKDGDLVEIDADKGLVSLIN